MPRHLHVGSRDDCRVMKSILTIVFFITLLVSMLLVFNTPSWDNDLLPNGNGEVLKIGMMADIHYATDKGRGLTPEYQQWVLNTIRSWVTWGADFGIQLGDISSDQGPSSLFRSPTDSLLQHEYTYNNVWMGNLPLYNVMGNHEVGVATKVDILALWHLPEGSTVAYYSFDWGDFHFIVLDSMNYECAEGNPASWAQYHFEISEHQKNWLIQDLANSHKPTIGFVHVPLSGYFYPDCDSGKPYYNRIINAPSIWQILSDDPDVIAWFEGHYHNFGDYPYHWSTLESDNRGNTYEHLNLREIHFYGLSCPVDNLAWNSYGLLTLDSTNHKFRWEVRSSIFSPRIWEFEW